MSAPPRRNRDWGKCTHRHHPCQEDFIPHLEMAGDLSTLGTPSAKSPSGPLSRTDRRVLLAKMLRTGDLGSRSPHLNALASHENAPRKGSDPAFALCVRFFLLLRTKMLREKALTLRSLTLRSDPAFVLTLRSCVLLKGSDPAFD